MGRLLKQTKIMLVIDHDDKIYYREIENILWQLFLYGTAKESKFIRPSIQNVQITHITDEDGE
jgi:hypothetical protein